MASLPDLQSRLDFRPRTTTDFIHYQPQHQPTARPARVARSTTATAAQPRLGQDRETTFVPEPGSESSCVETSQPGDFTAYSPAFSVGLSEKPGSLSGCGSPTGEAVGPSPDNLGGYDFAAGSAAWPGLRGRSPQSAGRRPVWDDDGWRNVDALRVNRGSAASTSPQLPLSFGSYGEVGRCDNEVSASVDAPADAMLRQVASEALTLEFGGLRRTFYTDEQVDQVLGAAPAAPASLPRASAASIHSAGSSSQQPPPSPSASACCVHVQPGTSRSPTWERAEYAAAPVPAEVDVSSPPRRRPSPESVFGGQSRFTEAGHEVGVGWADTLRDPVAAGGQTSLWEDQRGFVRVSLRATAPGRMFFAAVVAHEEATPFRPWEYGDTISHRYSDGESAVQGLGADLLMHETWLLTGYLAARPALSQPDGGEASTPPPPRRLRRRGRGSASVDRRERYRRRSGRGLNARDEGREEEHVSGDDADDGGSVGSAPRVSLTSKKRQIWTPLEDQLLLAYREEGKEWEWIRPRFPDHPPRSVTTHWYQLVKKRRASGRRSP